MALPTEPPDIPRPVVYGQQNIGNVPAPPVLMPPQVPNGFTVPAGYQYPPQPIIGPDLSQGLGPGPFGIFGGIASALSNAGRAPLAQIPLPGVQQLGQLTGTAAGDVASLFAPPIRPEQFDNPLYALGPEGGFAGNIGEAVGPLAGQIGGRLAGGLGQIARGRLPQFATEAAGAGRLDLGAGVPDKFTATILKDGTAVVKNAAGEVVQTFEKARGAFKAAQAEASRLNSGGAVAAVAEKTAPEAASPITRLTDENLFALRQNENLPPDVRKEVAAEVQRRGAQAFGTAVPETAVTQIPTEVADTVRRSLRGEAQIDPHQLYAAVNDALDKAKIPQTAENRAALTDALVQQQTERNTAAAAARGEHPAALPATPPVGTAEANPRSPGFFSRTLSELINFPRAIRATADISQLLRQGLVPIVSGALSRSARRRVIAAGAFKNALRGYSERFSSETWARTQADPLFNVWKDAGGFESSIPARGLAPAGPKEEFFQSTLAEKIPGVGKVVTAAERSYGLTLNALRFETWKEAYLAREAAGRPMTEIEQKALAKWLNVATGRGSLGDFSAASKVLNGLFFAPRFAISRIQAPILATQLLRDPATREIGKTAAKDLAKTVVAGMTFLQIADAAGLKVGWNPTSTDFGKIKIGNTTLDIWGGFQQPAVMVARLVLNRYTDSKGVSSSLSGAKFGQPTVLDVLERFAESKIGPTPGIILALAQGKNYVGEPFGPRGGQSIGETVANVAGQSIVPLGWGDVVDAVRDLGLPSGLIVGGTSLLGAGVQTKNLTPQEKTQQSLRERYFATPAFVGTTKTQEAAVYRALQQYRTLKGNKTVAEARADPNLRNFYNSAAGGLLRKYATDAGGLRSELISPERKKVQSDPAFKDLSISLDEILSHY